MIHIIHMSGPGASIPLRRWCMSPPVSDFPSVSRGVHPPWGHDAFPPVSDFPLIFKKFSNSVENFPNFTLSRKNFRFSSAKISYDLFLVINHKFRISFLFSLFQYIFPSVSRKLLFHPYISLCFRKIHLLFTYFMCISFPPTLTMMHLCITQCTYWTPLPVSRKLLFPPYVLTF